MSYDQLLPKLDQWPKEQALALDMLGRWKEAAFALASLCSLEEAEAYARRRERDEAGLFDTVLDGLTSKVDADSNAALSFFSRNFNRMQDTVRGLSLFDDDIPLAQCMDLVRVGLADKAASHRDHLVVKKLLRQEELVVMEKLLKEKARYVVLDVNSPVCDKCQRAFKADSPVVLWVGSVWHYSCFTQTHPDMLLS